MMSLKRILLLTPVILSSVCCDRITKSVAKKDLAGSPVQSFWGNLFRLQYAENPGAFLGMGAGLPKTARVWIFIIAVGAGVLVWTLSSRGLRSVGVVVLSLVQGRGLSNLNDRIFDAGTVVDFLNLGLGGLRTGVFNVADVGITTGLTLLLIGKFIRGQKEPEHGKI